MHVKITLTNSHQLTLVVLQEFGDHPNVIKLLNVLKADNDRDIYLVFEFMGKMLLIALQLLICSNNFLHLF